MLQRLLRPETPQTEGIHVRTAQNRMMGDSRYGHAWEDWDADLAAGQPRSGVLHRTTSDMLVHLLSAQAGTHRALERNIVATELLNRLELAGPGEKAESDRRLELWNIVISTSRRAQESRTLIAQSRRLLTEQKNTRACATRQASDLSNATAAR